MASEVFNSEMLLKRKELLINKIHQTLIEQEEAEFEKDTFYNMFLTIREQRTHDIAKVNEIRPYFDFQQKIHLILDRIIQTNGLRVKVQDVKIKQCKLQAKENKKDMTVSLKERVGELLEEEQENMTHKIKMVATRGLTKQETTANKNKHMKQMSSTIEGLEFLHKQPEKLVYITPGNYRKMKMLSE